MIVVTVARKPMTEGSVAANVLKHGTGAVNINATRIPTSDNLNGGAYTENRAPRAMSPLGLGARQVTDCGPFQPPSGRWPANLILEHKAQCEDLNCAEGCAVKNVEDQTEGVARFFRVVSE
jgi:site-specific DNA-methyltransferase (adenine-specific)